MFVDLEIAVNNSASETFCCPVIVFPQYVGVWLWQLGHKNLKFSNLLSVFIPLIWSRCKTIGLPFHTVVKLHHSHSSLRPMCVISLCLTTALLSDEFTQNVDKSAFAIDSQLDFSRAVADIGVILPSWWAFFTPLLLRFLIAGQELWCSEQQCLLNLVTNFASWLHPYSHIAIPPYPLVFDCANCV